MNAMQEALGCPSASEIEGVERDRRWLFPLGIFSIVLGFIAISAPGLSTFASILLLGVLLLGSGLFQIFRTIKAQPGKEFILHLVISILYIVAGLLMIISPGASAMFIALLMAAFFMVGGIFRIVGAFAMKFQSWTWMLFNGIVTLILGILIMSGWPLIGMWVIGLYVGIEMIVYGWSLLMFAAAERAQIHEIRRLCETQI